MTWLDHRSKRVEKCKLVGWWEEEKTRVISFSLLLPSGDPLSVLHTEFHPNSLHH